MSLLQLTETTLFFFNLAGYDYDPASPKKYALAGCIPGWVSGVPDMPISKPDSKANTTGSSVHPRSTTIVSKLTKGSTISSNVAPPSTLIGTSNSEGFAGSKFSNLYASDEEDDLLAKPLTSEKAFKVSLILSVFTFGVS